MALHQPGDAGALCVDSMVQTADNLAREHDIARACRTPCLAQSTAHRHDRCKAGWRRDHGGASRQAVRASRSEDEHPRPDITPPVANSSRCWAPQHHHAGNASGLNDGACALLRRRLQRYTDMACSPWPRHQHSSGRGCSAIMGIGPVPAIHKLLAKIGLRLDDFDCIESMKPSPPRCWRVRVVSDWPTMLSMSTARRAIALGHPLGASGGRLVMTAAMLCVGSNSPVPWSVYAWCWPRVALALERA